MNQTAFSPTTDITSLPVLAGRADSTAARVEQHLDRLDELFAQMDAGDFDVKPLGYVWPADWTLSVVIPVFNEQATILDVIARIESLPIPKEVIVVDDCSTDGTRGWLETLRGKPELKLIFKPRNEGKGAAVRTGFTAASGEVVIVQDADLEYEPTDIPKVLEPIARGDADVVYGSRYVRGASCRDASRIHRLGNRLLTGLSNWLTGVQLTDMETCYKAFRRGVLQTIELKQNRFGFEPEITAKVARRRFRIREVPIRYQPRSYAAGKKIGVRDLINTLWCILRYGCAD